MTEWWQVFGNPDATHCRHCAAHKATFMGYRLCPNCDVVHAIVR